MKKLLFLSSIVVIIVTTAFCCQRDGDSICPHHKGCSKDSIPVSPPPVKQGLI